MFLPALPALGSTSPLSAQPPILAITQQQWTDFNTTLGGTLRQGFPVARPCFANVGANVAGSMNIDQCSAVQSSYKSDLFIADNFGAYQNSNWATCQATGDQCLLDYNLPQNPLAYTLKTCKQGSVSTYYVDVAQPSDVQETFIFAKTHGIPLAIKNSGHDYKGRSSAPYSLGIWTHHLTGITRDQKFVPAGCPSSQTFDGVTMGAGQNFRSLYEFAEEQGITIVGGSSSTVGASGGWIAGGGHSAVSNTLGLGVDRALQFKVVTPDGQYRTVSACQNTDLFFALRGGGGSTFGVVMESTTTAAPKLTLQVAYFKYASADLAVSRAFIKILVANAQKWAGEGWGGYIQPGAITEQTGGLVMFTPLLNNSAATLSMEPIANFVKTLGTLAINSEVTEEPSFLTAYNKYIVPNEELVGLEVVVASRLVPTANFDPKNQAQLVDAIINGMETVGTNALELGSGLAYGGAPTQFLVTSPISFKHPTVSAVTPAWRDTIWHVLYVPTFNYDASTAFISSAFQRASKAIDFVRAITPPGAYQNEADIHEPDYQVSFWGQENYDKLVPIKAKYDPDNILECWMCIGWSQASATTNPRYACYP